ncbi:MAG: hypothetical protein FWD16_07270, partial [Clostridia bacterium]|nr:hypothetical protein [Clostridia bacterium]
SNCRNGTLVKDELCGYTHAGGLVCAGIVPTNGMKPEDIRFNECVNYATIYSTSNSGGIMGTGVPSSESFFASIGPDDIVPIVTFYRCFNFGKQISGRGTGGIGGVMSYGWHIRELKYPEKFRPTVFIECLSQADITISDLPGSYYGGITAGYSNTYRNVTLERCIALNTVRILPDPYGPNEINSRDNGGLTGIYTSGVTISDSYVGGRLEFGPGAGWPSGGIATNMGNADMPNNIQRVFQNSNYIAEARDSAGLVGRANYNLTMQNCYYNTDRMTGNNTKMISVQYGTVPATLIDNGAYTNEQCKVKENFKNYDFENVWGIHPDVNDGMPFLRWAAEYYPGGENFGKTTQTPTPTATPTPTPSVPTESATAPGPSATNNIAASPTTAVTLATTEASATQMPPTPTLPPIMPGDADCNGAVNIDDILLVRDVIFGVKPLTGQGRRNLFLNEGERVSIDQILLIRDVIFGVHKPQ